MTFVSQIDLKDRLILALDVADVKTAENIVSELSDHVGFYKIGLQQILGGGIEFAKKLITSGHKVFLDAKLLDIGETVKNATKNIADIGADFLTVHAEPQAISSAVKGREDSNLKILAVTVLTSLNAQDIKNLGYELSIEDLVLLRARQAINAGADGLICSGKEVSLLREEFGNDILIVTPGVRPAFSALANDQRRVVTPRESFTLGADYIVIGRPILNSRDKIKAVKSIFAEIESSFE